MRGCWRHLLLLSLVFCPLPVSIGAQAGEIENYIVVLNTPPLADRLIQRAADRATALSREQETVIEDLRRRGIVRSVGGRFNFLLNGFVVAAPRQSREILAQTNGVKNVYIDYRVYPMLNASLAIVGAPSVWKLNDKLGNPVTGKGVRVAVIDTGVDYTHPDLGGCFGPGCKVAGGYDFVSDDSDPMDTVGHGTWVAGIIAANGKLKGVAPDASILAYRVLGPFGGRVSSVVFALDRAANPDGDPSTPDQVDIVNMSIGGTGEALDPLVPAVERAVELGMLIVAAAGNSVTHMSVATPGRIEALLTVGSSDKQDALSDFSSRGPAKGLIIKPDLLAPGEDIEAPSLGGGYVSGTGTSAATPHVAGAAALLKQLHPNWNAKLLKARLMNTALSLGSDPFTEGAGRMRVDKAATGDVVAYPGSLSLGIVDNAASVWTTTKQVEVFNTSDKTQNLRLSVAPVPAEASIQLSEASLTLDPGQSRTVSLEFRVDSTLSPKQAVPFSYHGAVIVETASEQVRVPFAFLKPPPPPEEQRAALEAFHKSTNGINWRRAGGWLGPPGSEEKWYGLTTLGGHVLGMELPFNDVTGRIPPEVESLRHLQFLNLSFNSLEESLPAQWSRLSRLKLLDLSFSDVPGKIPAELGSLAELRILLLGFNKFDGPFPPELGRLGNLRVLDLSANSLGAEIPAEIGQLKKLIALALADSEFERLPPEISNLTNLRQLYLSFNKFATLPPEIGSLVNLQDLALDGNSIAELPRTLGGLSRLEALDLSGNKLTRLPSELGQLSRLSWLDLRSNQLVEIPPELGNLAELGELSLGSNQLRALPGELGKLGKLATLGLSGNQLKRIPSEIGNLNNLQSLSLSFNQLVSLPAEIGRLKKLASLSLWSNFLTQIPPEIGNLASLRFLDLEDNQLTQLPPESANLSNLITLFANSNRLRSIPVQLSQLTRLQNLYLDSNQISGLIPPELGNLSELRTLVLSSNRLKGAIPPQLGQLKNLRVLALDSNQLSGTIPVELAQLERLWTLHLTNNRLEGAIPAELGKLTALSDLYLDANQLSGSIPSDLGKLGQLWTLRLNSNRLTGQIPPELGRLSSLRTLRLNSNLLSGPIPAQLKELSRLSKARSDFRWNALYTQDAALRNFLREKQIGEDWESTQTVAPESVSAAAVNESSVDVQWTPIPYTGDDGAYEVHQQVRADQYQVIATTSDKKVSSLRVTGLGPGLTHSFAVRTVTSPHPDNANKVLSEFSSEIRSETPGTQRMDVSITKSHNGHFVVGTDRTYQLTVRNVGSLATTGPITVTDRLPQGLAFRSIGASGWNCSSSVDSITCTYADSAEPGLRLPPILITVRITEAAVPQVTNTAGVSVSADNNPANDVASVSAEVRQLRPVIVTLEPTSALAGSSGLSLKVNGSNFVPGTTVQWNGIARQTAFLSESELQADISAVDLASPARNPVTVVNPPGAGGVSNSKDFFVYRARCPGDANGDSTRDLLDVSRVARHALNVQSLTAQQVTEADLDGNGSADVVDLVRLIRHLLETSRLPDCR